MLSQFIYFGKTLTCKIDDVRKFVDDEIDGDLFACITWGPSVASVLGKFNREEGIVFSNWVGSWTEVTLAPVFVPGLSTMEFCSHSVQMLAYNNIKTVYVI